MKNDPLIYFKDRKLFRNWLMEHHQNAGELWVGYYKKGSGQASITWPESVEEALCFGWIDGIRRSVDEERYKIRFTPRKANSNWSEVNIKSFRKLKKDGLVYPAGLQAFERRKTDTDGKSAYDRKEEVFAASCEKEFRQHPKAWAFFEALAPSYKKSSIWYVVSAKREETRQKRLKILIDSSEKGKKIPLLR